MFNKKLKEQIAVQRAQIELLGEKLVDIQQQNQALAQDLDKAYDRISALAEAGLIIAEAMEKSDADIKALLDMITAPLLDSNSSNLPVLKSSLN